MTKFAGLAFRSLIPSLLLVSLGFILCMHWFLLMADSRIEGVSSSPMMVGSVISTIMAYYTVVFGPMTWLIKVFILLMFVTMTLQLFIREIPWYLKGVIFLIKAPLILNGVFYIIPLVDKFISNTNTPEVQLQMVWTIHDAHVFSAIGTAVAIILQLIVLILLQRRAEAK